ncbi:HWE histidine kinase domain-containing protein [Limimaricola litoreus]
MKTNGIGLSFTRAWGLQGHDNQNGQSSFLTTTAHTPSSQLLAALCDRASEALLLLDAQNCCIFMNRAAEALTGYRQDEMRGRSLWDVIGQDGADLSPHDRFPIASGQPQRDVLMDRSGQAHPIIYTASPVREGGEVVGTVLEMRPTGGDQAAIAALKEETRMLEILNRTGSMLASKLDLEEIVQAVTEAATELAGAQFGAFFYNVIRDGEALQLYTLSGASRDAFAAFPQPRHTAVFEPTFAQGRVVRSPDIRRDPRYGRNPPFRGMPESHLPASSYLSVPVLACNGTIHGALIFGHEDVGVFTERSERIVTAIAAQATAAIDNAALFEASQREIAERQKAEAHQKLLIQELNHRVKNMLATVQSLARRTLRGRAEEAAMRSFQDRLHALSHSHSLIMRQNWQAVDLKDLAHTALAPFLDEAKGEARARLDGPPVCLEPKVALALGMGFHELVANAARHGALRGDSGYIDLCWRTMEDGTLHISWTEKDGPPVEAFGASGFGSYLLRHGLAHELGGDVQMRADRSGVSWDIFVPEPGQLQ